jgi:PAS domain S-box-containing protein
MNQALRTTEERAQDGPIPDGPVQDGRAHVERLEREAERERKARHEAEAIAERSLRHLYAQKEQLALLQALAAAANAAGSVEEATQEALSLVCKHTGWPVGHVYRRRGDGLVPTGLWCGKDEERFAGWRAVTEATSFARGEGLPGRVLASGKPAWIRDVAQDANFPRAAEAAAHGLHGGMAFPVLVADEVAAVLEFFSEQPEEPDEALLELVAYAGVQLGYVVERQRIERRHELILAAAGDGIYGLDADGRTTFVNDAAAELLGWPQEELLGRASHHIFHHHRADGTPYPVEECPLHGVHGVLRTGSERRVAGEVFWRRDGTSFPVEYVATPIREGGDLAGAVVVFRDVTERAALALLRQSEAQLLSLVDHLPELAWTARPDGHIDFYNRRWYEYTGTRFEEMEGWGWEEVHDPEVLPEVVAQWKRSIETGEPFEMEFPLRGADGAFRWFLTRVNPLRDAEGRITRWIGTNANIDEQKQTAAALEEARRDLAEVNRTLEERVAERTHELSDALQALGDKEALLHSVTSNALDGIVALEAVRDAAGAIVDFRWLLVNPTAEAVYGRRRDELVGALQSAVLPDVKPMGLHDALARVVETGEPFRQEVPAPEEPGRWFSLSVSKLGDGVVALFRDVSEAKAAEAALRASERQLQQAQKLAHVGSWQWDVASDRVTWSDELYRIFGHEPGAIEVDYERYAAHLHPEDREAIGRTVQRALETGEGYELNHRTVRPDGAVRWIHSFGEVVRDEAGTIVALRGTAQDVTERVEAQQALRRYATELEESNEELQKFAYVASHDLQEPLRMVTSFLQLLERRYTGQLDDTAREYIGYAVDGARRMQRLIQDLLAYSRVGTRAQDFEAVDAGEVVLDVLHDLGPAVTEAGAAVEAEHLPVVLADKTQLHQLLLNLVGNALKFRKPDETPRIRIAAEPAKLADDRPAWRFAVADNGIGFDPQYAERIFQVFQRLHTRDEYEGTGIGLAICRKIVERHGGTIEVASAPGEGTTFTFTLPAPPRNRGAATS